MQHRVGRDGSLLDFQPGVGAETAAAKVQDANRAVPRSNPVRAVHAPTRPQRAVVRPAHEPPTRRGRRHRGHHRVKLVIHSRRRQLDDYLILKPWGCLERLLRARRRPLHRVRDARGDVTPRRIGQAEEREPRGFGSFRVGPANFFGTRSGVRGDQREVHGPRHGVRERHRHQPVPVVITRHPFGTPRRFHPLDDVREAG